jgi:predicted dehydrogenase
LDVRIGEFHHFGLVKLICTDAFFDAMLSSQLASHPDIDLILVASADEYHASHAIQAADNGKHVFIEKPMTLTRAEAKEVEEARKRNNVHISIAYMRRYTPVWGQFLKELEEAGPITFARVFDYPGPNSTFVSQSSTNPQPFISDIPKEASEERKSLATRIATSILGEEKSKDARLVTVYRLLGGLGSHDISCMRHAFGGVPKECLSAFASPDGLFIGASFLYNQPDGSPFLVSYETGVQQVSIFEAFIEVWCKDRIIRIDYDTPYVKGLPIKLTIRENTGKDGKGYQERSIRPTYEDAYSAEYIRLSKALRQSSSVLTDQQSTERKQWAESLEMCSPIDAVHDLDVFDMIMKHLV